MRHAAWQLGEAFHRAQTDGEMEHVQVVEHDGRVDPGTTSKDSTPPNP